MKGKRFWAVFLLAALMAAGSGMTAQAGDGLLWDLAALLSEDEGKDLKQRAEDLADDTGYDIMLVTADDSEGREASEYAEDFFMDHKTTLDGVVYLIDMDNREIYVATSGDARFLLDDDRIDQILDDAYEGVSEARYGDAFSAMLDDTEQFVAEGIREGAFLYDEDTGKIQRYREPKRITPGKILAALVGGLAAAGLFFGVTVARYKRKLGKYSYEFRDHSELELRRSEDRFVNRIVTHRHIPKNPPSGGPGGGGGIGSGSSVHTGSGGNSFGGGGRSF